MVKTSDADVNAHAGAMQRVSAMQQLWGWDLSQLKNVKLRDYAIRFVFGGGVSVLAAAIGAGVSPRIGGIFTAFPAILLASLTMIDKQEGKKKSAADARGAVVGAVALLLTSILLTLTLGGGMGLLSLVLALIAWLLCSLGFYLLSAKAGWLRVEDE
jgi:Protein of unknown function (DUF3147)